MAAIAGFAWVKRVVPEIMKAASYFLNCLREESLIIWWKVARTDCKSVSLLSITELSMKFSMLLCLRFDDFNRGVIVNWLL